MITYVFVVEQCELPSLDNIHYSHQIATPGDVVEVTCDAGYILKGPGNITCQQNETFDVTSFPTCRCK